MQALTNLRSYSELHIFFGSPFINGSILYISTMMTSTYSPILLASIVTTGNFASLSDSVGTFFLYFLNTNNVSGYIMTPVITSAFYDHHLSYHTLTAVLCHTLQHILHFTHPSPTYTQTSFINSLLKNDVPPFLSNVNPTYQFLISCIKIFLTLSL